jgi:8-oxo-dGTP pyrophosphatase MutT (NUDIX family)
MTQPTFWQKIRRATAGFVGALFLFTTVTTPMVEANFWEQRRDASRRVSGKSQGSPALMAGLSGSIGANDSVLPAVNGALGSGLPSVSSANLKGVPSAVDVRASALPAWLRGLPNSAGEIRDVALAKNADKAPVVVLIQDVHNVFSAQKNIAQIVSHIDSAAARDNRGPVLIGLEGGVGAFDIARFRASRGRAGHALATELLLKTNLIAGPEFYAFQSEKEPLLWGVETREDYIENAEAVRAGHPVAERVAAAIASAEMAVEKRAEAVFSPELKDLNRILAAHNRGDSSIVDLVRVLKAHAPKASVPEVDKLQKALDMEKGLDFAQVERERKALIEVLVRVLDASSIEKLTAASLSYRAGQMNFGTYHAQLKALVKSHGIRWSEYGEFDKYVQYVLLSESIDKFRLFDQIEDLKARAVANLGRSKEEKSLMGLAEDLRLVHRLVRHEFGPAEWKSYQERKTDLARLNVRLAEALGADAVAGVSAQDLAPFERFYVAADRRNDSLAANLMAKGKEVDAQVMVLVAGGFHTAELESRIKSKGYSVVTLTPAIGEIPTDLNYLDIFTVKNIPLEQFLKGEKLYFSPPRPLSYGAGDLLPGSPATADAAGTIYSAAAAAIEKVSGVESSGSAIAGVTAKVKSNGEVVTATAETGPAVQAWPTGQTPQNGPATGVAVSGEVNRRNVTAALLTGSSAKTSNLSLNGRFSSVLKKTGVLVSRGVRFVFGWPMRAIGSISQFAKSEEFQRTWSVAVNEFGLMFSPWNLPSTHSLRWNGRTSQGMKGWGIFMGTTLLTAWVVASALLLPFGLDNNSLILAQGAFTLALTAPLSLPMHVAYNYSPLAKKFGRLTADELSTETLERLKAEILNTETRYFNLRTLSESYGMSVDAMSSILRKLGQEKTLRFPDGGWTSLLTIDRPEGAKGEGPFIARFQEVHRRGYVHHSVAVIAVTPDGRLVLQHRKDKNQFDVGASGHVDIGESPRMAAAHELAEELGIDLGKSNLTERLVPIPNPERAGGAFFKEGGKSFADFLYKSNNLDFSGPSKEKNNRENVHLYTVLLTEQEVLQIEGNGNGKPGKPKTVTGFLPLQFLLDFQERMADAASLFARYWFPQGQRPMKPSDREVDRVEIIDPLELIQAVGGNGEQYASSLRHFFQGEKIRSIVTGYLRGLLSAQELGQDLGRAALLDGMNRANSYGMTLVAGHPFSEIGILQDVVVSLRRGLSVASHGRIPDFGDKSHSTLAPLVRSKATPVNPDDLTRVDLNAVLATLAATSPLELEIESVSFGDLRDGSIVMTLRQVGEPGALQKLREKLMAAGLPFKFSPEQTGDRMYIQLSLIGPEAFAKMTESEIASVRSWMEFHSDLKSWWDLHRRFQLEEQKNTPGFSDQAWLETELKRPVNEIFMNVWRLEEENLRGLPLVEPIEMISEIMVASYSNRRLTGLVSQGVTLPLGQASVEFSNAQALVEQVAIVQAGLDYHGGRLKTSPVPGHTRPSVQGDVPYLPDMSQDEKERLAQIGLQHINKGTYAILAAGAASRMASGLPADVMKKLRKMWKTGNPPLPRSKAAVPIAEIGDKIFTFLGAFLTNVNAFYSALKGLGIVPTSNVLVYSNDNYISELETELKNHNNYGLPGSQIDRDLLQQLRPQFGAKVSDVKKMQTDGKFKNQQDYLFALEKARRLEEKLKQGEGEAALLMEEKAPHGHGEFLHDFVASGKLLSMIDSGKEWMFVRNVDNVGATLDFNFLVTLGLFIEKGLDFQVEVSPRLPGMKGGALIITQAGQQILTEGPSFAATWKVVEQNIAEEGYTPLEKSAGEEHIREVFRNGSRLDLSPTRMDFEGSRVDSLGDALTMLQDDTVRLYKTSDGKVLAVRHIVPESTYWFNNATAIISPRFFYFVYRRDDNQTYDEFVEEMRRAMSSDHGGLQAIAQRGKARFPILLDAKPTKSGGVGQKPETNMWQSTQAAIEKLLEKLLKSPRWGLIHLSPSKENLVNCVLQPQNSGKALWKVMIQTRPLMKVENLFTKESLRNRGIKQRCLEFPPSMFRHQLNRVDFSTSTTLYSIFLRTEYFGA